VYGEGPQITQIDTDGIHRLPQRNGLHIPRGRRRLTQKRKNSNDGVDEDSGCHPSSDYAFSKLDAERRPSSRTDKIEQIQQILSEE
jgi:hypothetical protein